MMVNLTEFSWSSKVGSRVLLTILVAVTACVRFSDGAVGCFVCSSVNGSDPACEDKFNNTENYYHQFCRAGRKDREGLFMGTECLKLKARHPTHKNYTVVVRQCVVDNGDINFDTEIGRIDHCGLVKWVDVDTPDGFVRMNGCIMTCRTDGCNGAARNDVRLTVVCALAYSFATAAGLFFNRLQV